MTLVGQAASSTTQPALPCQHRPCMEIDIALNNSPLAQSSSTTFIALAAPPISYTVKDAATACGLSVSTLRAAIKRGTLTVRWLNTKPIVRHEDLATWIDELPQDNPADLF